MTFMKKKKVYYMAKIADSKTYHFLNTDRVLVDTNIWISFLYQTHSNYATTMERLISCGADLIVSTLVISEYINVRLKHEFKRYKDNQKRKFGYQDIDYKTYFRESQEYKEVYKKVMLSVKDEILPFVKILDNNGDYLNDLIADYELLDFNDHLNFKLASDNNLKILTDDTDFLDLSQDIIVIIHNGEKRKKPNKIESMHTS